MNQTLITNFKALIQHEKLKDSPNIFRIKTYSKVIKILSELDFDVTSSKQLDGIHGIGDKTKSKIDLIITNGKLDNLEYITNPITSNSPENTYQKRLETVTGIGPVKAKKLISEGYTLDKLQELFIDDPETLNGLLTHHQILGIKYYRDLEHRIPHKEIQKIEIFIKQKLEALNNTHFPGKTLKLEICGSYRRHAATSGDIDILYYEDNDKDNDDSLGFLNTFLNSLNSIGFLKDHLTDPSSVTTKYMGFCKLPRYKYVRRIDMRYIKRECLPAAKLYFTGNGEFNKNMRTSAIKKGFTLNEYGIFRLNKDKTKGEKQVVKTEADIFKLINMPFIKPNERLSTVRFL